MMLAVPALRLVTNPFTSTVATAVFDDDQEIARPVSTLLLASRKTADACDVAPATTVVAVNDTATVATGAGGAVTVNVA